MCECTCSVAFPVSVAGGAVGWQVDLKAVAETQSCSGRCHSNPVGRSLIRQRIDGQFQLFLEQIRQMSVFMNLRTEFIC